MPAKPNSGKTKRQTGKSIARNKRKGRKGRLLWRPVKFMIYWLSVLTIWSGVAAAIIIGYYAAFLPQTSSWTIPKRPPFIKILADDGRLIAFRGKNGGEALKLHEMPHYLPEAVIAIEDRRFYHHFGIDFFGLLRATLANIQAKKLVQGGSTITQQLAKNLFLNPERTLGRKVQEMILAFWLEWRLEKHEILEMYLNQVYFGAGAYGVDAAARAYFDKSAREIDLGEAALLAALLKAPSRYNPHRAPQLADRRAQTVLQAMQEEGYITEALAVAAAAMQPLIRSQSNPSSIHYIADWITQILPLYVGKLEQDIIVETSVSLKMQAIAEQAMRQGLAVGQKKSAGYQGALVTLNRNGAVKALIGGRDYRESPYNRALYSMRQPGSAFKPFVYLAALEHGLMPDSPVSNQPVKIGNWQPKNFDEEYGGQVNLSDALARSLNIVAARLSVQIGPHNIAQIAKRLGISAPLNTTPALALGTSGLSPLELASAYVPFANGGSAVIAHVIRQIRKSDGTILYHRKGSGNTKVIANKHIAPMNFMMRKAMEEGTGKAARLTHHRAGGKTGTSQNFRDAWFAGYTAQFTTIVWIGNDNNQPMRKVTGGGLPAQIWRSAMAEYHRDLQPVTLAGMGGALPMPTRIAANANAAGKGAGAKTSYTNPITALLDFFLP